MTASSRLDADTQATLLLCGRLGDSGAGAKPLSLGEYNKVAGWLREREMRPGDLVRRGAPEDVVRDWTDGRIPRERLVKLLGRGVGLGFAVERWASQGIWVLGRGDERYPSLLKRRLGVKAPALLFGVGNADLVVRPGIAVVGSRDADQEASWFANRLGRRCAEEELVVVSGDAKGIDREAMNAALDAGGSVVGVLPEGVAKPATRKMNRTPLHEGRLVLLSDLDPDARWASWAAMARNKYIYSLSRYAVAVASGTDGGTWAGAVENLSKGWVPLFVRADEQIPTGNRALLQQGGHPIGSEVLAEDVCLLGRFEALAGNAPDTAEPVGLFMGEASAPPAEAREASTTPVETVDDLTASVSQASTTHATPAERDDREHSGSPRVGGDLFEVVWPHLAPALASPTSPDELAEMFEVNKAQMRAWLEKAVDRRVARKLARPVRYVMNPQSRIDFG